MLFSMTSLRVVVCCRVNLAEADRLTADEEEDARERRLCAQLEKERKRNAGGMEDGAIW